MIEPNEESFSNNWFHTYIIVDILNKKECLDLIVYLSCTSAFTSASIEKDNIWCLTFIIFKFLWYSFDKLIGYIW